MGVGAVIGLQSSFFFSLFSCTEGNKVPTSCLRCEVSGWCFKMCSELSLEIVLLHTFIVVFAASSLFSFSGMEQSIYAAMQPIRQANICIAPKHHAQKAKPASKDLFTIATFPSLICLEVLTPAKSPTIYPRHDTHAQ